MGSPCWAVFVIPSPTGSQLTIMIAKLILVIAIGGHCVLGARRLTASAAVARDGKSLVNTFPFNANHGDHHAHDHHDHHDHRAPSQSAGSSKEPRSVTTRSRLWLATLPRSSAPWSPRGPASTSPSWSPS